MGFVLRFSRVGKLLVVRTIWTIRVKLMIQYYLSCQQIRQSSQAFRRCLPISNYYHTFLWSLYTSSTSYISSTSLLSALVKILTSFLLSAAPPLLLILIPLLSVISQTIVKLTAQSLIIKIQDRARGIGVGRTFLGGSSYSFLAN